MITQGHSPQGGCWRIAEFVQPLQERFERWIHELAVENGITDQQAWEWLRPVFAEAVIDTLHHSPLYNGPMGEMMTGPSE